MSYHGYDVTDYSAIDPKLGTVADLDRLVAEAHAKGIKVYLDYVMNHTGTKHSWFTQACSSSMNTYRDYYSFSEDPQTDISAGKIAMIAKEGAAGYKAGEWFQVANENSTITGILKFTLNRNNCRCRQS